MNANVDLRRLAVRRETPPEPPRRARRIVARYVVPAAVVFGFLGVLGWAARDTLLPARPVTVVPVLTSRAEVRQEGEPLFQAAGWVEPRPTPVFVPALTEGVVAALLVVEGQEVKAGEPVARLIDTDARLALAMAEVDVRLRRAEVTSAAAARAAARLHLAQPTALQAAVAEAEATLAQKENEWAVVPFQRRAAQAKLDALRADYDAKASVASVPAGQLRQAKGEAEAAAAAIEEFAGREKRLQREVEALRAKRDALRQRLDLKADETRQAADAEAQVEAAAARLRQAELAVDAARLRLERTTIVAPSAGRVLALMARPGQRLMGGFGDGSTVVSLYDPANLQVRADVRLEDVPRVRPGQAVRVETAAAPAGPLDGAVLFTTSQADMQKNTLQVKVAVTAPPATLRPDMLVKVTFLAPPTEKPAAPSTTLRLLAPKALVDGGDGGTTVWIADRAAGVARRQAIQLGATAGDWVEVVSGLNPGDRLIVSGRDGLRDGARIRVTGEEAPTAPAVHH